jgi:hypothetical protein
MKNERFGVFLRHAYLKTPLQPATVAIVAKNNAGMLLF